jgi:hypothetical protein
MLTVCLNTEELINAEKRARIAYANGDKKKALGYFNPKVKILPSTDPAAAPALLACTPQCSDGPEGRHAPRP